MLIRPLLLETLPNKAASMVSLADCLHAAETERVEWVSER